MPDVLERVGWTTAMPVLAEDMIQLEQNIEDALRTHVHGDGTVVAIDPALVPAPSGAVGGVATLLAHLLRSDIHFAPNTNLPNVYSGRVSVPSVNGGNAAYSVDVTFPGYTLASFKVFSAISFPGGGVVSTPPEGACISAEVLTANSFRLHVKYPYNPFTTYPAIDVVWETHGTDGSTLPAV